ncbi:VanZ family protein [uncultured Microbacterium sp.]|uniref:VanZ family protein n=1 Tax=uncultured Microbacterium sp. TaxID=191216 RepID=UPI0035CBF43B
MSERRWVLIGLGVYGAVIIGLLLAPVSVTGILDLLSSWVRNDLGVTSFGSGWIEFAANILMFVPLGFLLTLLLPKPWQGVLLAIALSIMAEVAQIVIPSRQASLRDVLANATGAAIGAALALLVVRRRRRRADAAASRSSER